MSARLLRRMSRMSSGELSFRAFDAARRQVERLRVVTREPRWDRRQLAQALSPLVLDGEMKNAIAGGRWSLVGRRLAEAIRQRPSRYVLDSRHATALGAEIRNRWPGAEADARQRGDSILSGRFDLLGYSSLTFADEGVAVNWHFDPVHQRSAPRRFWVDVPFLDPACGDHKVIWELNRHQHFLALGRAFWLTRDDRYAARIVDDLRSWLEANPPLIGINWASSLELAFRSLSWLSAIHFLLAPGTADRPSEHDVDQSWLVDVFVGLDAQLNQVERHLSRYFSPNTHLTGEALALYVAGAALPELRHSRQWMTTGRTVLLEEIERQICADGGHAELATAYHRYTLDFYSLALLTAELADDTAALPAFRDAVERLAIYMGAFCRSDGRAPAIGDDDGGLLWPITARDPFDVRGSLALAAVLSRGQVQYPQQPTPGLDNRVSIPEDVLWLAWNARPELRTARWLESAPFRCGGPVDARHMHDTGYVVAHNVDGDHLTFDVGRHGFLNGGHAHADALSITLALGGMPYLIDPGTATYTCDPELRTRLRTSASHNTLTFDERSSAIPGGAFHWNTRATARLETSALNPAFMLAEGTHDGYAPGQHRRIVVHGHRTGWLVVDCVTAVTRLVDSHWHFDPSWRVAPTDGGLLALGPAGARAWMLIDGGITTLFHGAEALGWCSPRYGSLIPTFAARVRRAGSVHKPHVTWIGATEEHEPPRLRRLNVESDGEAVVAVLVDHDGGSTLTLLRPGDVTEPGQQLLRHGDLRCDGRLVQMRTSGQSASVSLMEASFLDAPASAFARVSATGPIADLHLALDGTSLEAWSTTPSAELQVRLDGSHRADRLRLNGRDVRLPIGGERTGVTELSIRPAEWGAPRTDHTTARRSGSTLSLRAAGAAMAGGVSC